MPKIQVTEKDLSWYYRQRDPSALTVYMPILASMGPEEPTLCDSSNFRSTYGNSSVGVAGDISYDMAASFIDVGLNVLVHRVVPTGSAAAKATLIADKLTVKAKAKGTDGNLLKIKGIRITGTDKSNSFRFFVKNDLGISVILNVEFTDETSDNYYKTVNETSSFVEFTVADQKAIDKTDALASDDYIKLAGGTDYAAGTTPENLKTAVTEAISTSGFFDILKDPYQYSFDIAVDGGFNDLSSTSAATGLSKVDTAFKSLVNSTKDAVYLVSGVSGLEAETFFGYCDHFETSYCAGYGPWGYAQLISTGSVANLPGYYALLISWANSIAAGNPVWMAPAGVKRSQLGTFYRKPEYEIGQVTLNTWQNQEDIGSEVDYKVNPIMKLKQYGYCIYGNSTLLKAGTGSTSMLQSFSVRILANQIKKHAFDISLSLQFDQLTDDLIVQFRTLMGVYMDQLQYSGALYDYNIVADYSALTSAQLNTKTVPVRIQISPNPAAENFEISLEISQAGVSFTDDTDETEVA